jgi:predicted CoA-binding protein
MTDERYSDEQIRHILNTVGPIAMVGASDNPSKPSYFVLKYLSSRGFTMIGINPRLAGQNILGVPVFGRLADVKGPIDMVEIFRDSTAAPQIVADALALQPKPKFIWMQLGIFHAAAAETARAAGLTVIMNRCPKIEYGRLSGEIGWTGVNSRILSAKRPKMAATGVQRRLLPE